MPFFFYIFAALAVIGGIGVVAYRNPVTSAFSMIISFIGLASLFIMLSAYLVGILQILVYAGAIMVLFLFIIMLLDVKEEEKKGLIVIPFLGAVIVSVGFIVLLFTVLGDSGVGNATFPAISIGEATVSDVHQIGIKLFSEYWFPIQMVGILLLVATVGVIVLSKKELK